MSKSLHGKFGSSTGDWGGCSAVSSELSAVVSNPWPFSSSAWWLTQTSTAFCTQKSLQPEPKQFSGVFSPLQTLNFLFLCFTVPSSTQTLLRYQEEGTWKDRKSTLINYTLRNYFIMANVEKLKFGGDQCFIPKHKTYMCEALSKKAISCWITWVQVTFHIFTLMIENPNCFYLLNAASDTDATKTFSSKREETVCKLLSSEKVFK